MDDLKRERIDRVFIALHGRYGEDGTVQGALELLGIPYTGSGVTASAIGIDKRLTKRVWLTQGLPTPQFSIARSAAQVSQAAQALGLPMAVKPAREGSSLGFTRVDHPDQAAAAFEAAARHDGEVLCEQFIAGPELTLAYPPSASQAPALAVTDILAPPDNYASQNHHFTDDTRYDHTAHLPTPCSHPPAQLPPETLHSAVCDG